MQKDGWPVSAVRRASFFFSGPGAQGLQLGGRKFFFSFCQLLVCELCHNVICLAYTGIQRDEQRATMVTL